jgi:hypothetical protein
MTYHLPRIEHWLQNKNINHYYTTNKRQLISAPFSEFFILHGRALSGDDYLENLVQWFAYLGTIIGISKIVSHLGINKKMQIMAAIFFASVPMAILQASSTQTDLVESFYIICIVERLLAWRKNGTLLESSLFGLALGLSILTKGTAYAITFPFVIYFAVISIKNYRTRFIGAFLAGILCLLINIPHYTRNYITFHEPLGIHDGTVSSLSVKSFGITIFSNINSNLAFPLKRVNKLNQLLDKVWNTMKIDDKVFPFGRPKIEARSSLKRFYEDSVKNPFHMILVIITFLLLFFGKKHKFLGFLAISSWCMFFYLIPWQPWITRLQLPLFALTAPLFAIAFEDKRKYINVSIIILTFFAIFPLLLNYSRPLWYIKGITSNNTIWNTSRDELIFNNRHYDGSYIKACDIILKAEIKNLGVIIGGNDWEYPLWRYLRRNSINQIKIMHVKEDSVDDEIEALFILNRQISDSIQEALNLTSNNIDISLDVPLVIIRKIPATDSI